MESVTILENPRAKKTIEEWQGLSLEEQELLIPFLLHSMDTWRVWTTDGQRLSWLEDQFKNASVPFRRPLYEEQREEYAAAILTR